MVLLLCPYHPETALTNTLTIVAGCKVPLEWFRGRPWKHQVLADCQDSVNHTARPTGPGSPPAGNSQTGRKGPAPAGGGHEARSTRVKGEQREDRPGRARGGGLSAGRAYPSQGANKMPKLNYNVLLSCESNSDSCWTIKKSEK